MKNKFLLYLISWLPTLNAAEVPGTFYLCKRKKRFPRLFINESDLSSAIDEAYRVIETGGEYSGIGYTTEAPSVIYYFDQLAREMKINTNKIFTEKNFALAFKLGRLETMRIFANLVLDGYLKGRKVFTIENLRLALTNENYAKKSFVINIFAELVQKKILRNRRLLAELNNYKQSDLKK